MLLFSFGIIALSLAQWYDRPSASAAFMRIGPNGNHRYYKNSIYNRFKDYVNIHGIYCTNKIYSVVGMLLLWKYSYEIHTKYLCNLRNTQNCNNQKCWHMEQHPGIKHNLNIHTEIFHSEHRSKSIIILDFNASIRLICHIFMAGKSPNNV